MSFWLSCPHHALQMATYFLNILPSKLLSNKSPLGILHKRQPSYSHLRVFGCLCYPLFPSTTTNKLQPKSTQCVFLEFPPNHRGYKCYDLSSRKIIICKNVIFDENSFPFAKLHTPYVIQHITTSNDESNDMPLPPNFPVQPILRFNTPHVQKFE